MRDRKLYLGQIPENLDRIVGELEHSEAPIAVIRETVYSLPYEYHFSFGEEPRIEDKDRVLVWVEGALADRDLWEVLDDGERVLGVRIERLPRTRPTDIVILAPHRQEF